MLPIPEFTKRSPTFWAHVRTISEGHGYAEKRSKRILEPRIKVPTIADMKAVLEQRELRSDHIEDATGSPTLLGRDLLEYFETRARVLNEVAPTNLMDAEEAEALWAEVESEPPVGGWKCPRPMNKQSGDKRRPAYFTCLVNMLVERHSGGIDPDYDPRRLTTFTENGFPHRTLSRRVDGAFPGTVNPTAIWEIKEYYYTTTFGSRVSGGVYEGQLDGMEVAELNEYWDHHVSHYFFLDGYLTWWIMGKSYLCRIFDMLHMGYVDEVLLGREVYERLPVLVPRWCRELARIREDGEPIADDA